jgi:hypothetical protein
MTPNSFQLVVAADDVAARNAPSELGSAPLPPVAEIEAALAHVKTACERTRRRKDRIEWYRLTDIRERLKRMASRERRATGGNDLSSATGGESA